MNIDLVEKKYIDCRFGKTFVNSLEYFTTDPPIGGVEYDDVLAALAVNQLAIEDSGGTWELFHPEKIVAIEADAYKLYLFAMRMSQYELRVKIDSVLEERVRVDRIGCIAHFDVEDAGEVTHYNIMLPSTHGFLKIDNTNNKLKLGDIEIEL